MTNKTKKIVSSILLCTVFAGCASGTGSTAGYTYDGYVSPLRTGTMSQGIRDWVNNFECTETGSYFMCSKAATWLLYVDHGSDTVIKLCGRPNCDHIDSECNAFFKRATNICLYDGFLYTFSNIPFYESQLIRMNPDGTEKTVVYDATQFIHEEGYSRVSNTKIFNGMLIITLEKIDEKGEEIYGNYYYKLDGSMEKPKEDKYCDFNMYTDGEAIIGHDYENGIHTYGIWEPEKGMVSELLTSDTDPIHSFVGVKAEYYIEDGVIIQNSYTEGKKEMFDTGLKGNYLLDCFPDFITVYEYVPTEESLKGVSLDEYILYFYGWDGSELGSVKIDYVFNSGMVNLICGETAERIMLTDNVSFSPRYYINKSDFGTGNIEIHAFNVPEL